MSNPAAETFLKNLREAAVIPEQELSPILEQHAGAEPKVLARALVHAGLLTDWQAKFILNGRHRLRVGNYLLQERVRRDELGDCFLAVHEPLQRQVWLQILPESIVRQSPMFGVVTNLIGRLNTLDHPRLEHVFDLGEEGNRLYVVYEHTMGRKLDARGLATLTQSEAAGLLFGVSDALATMQDRKVAHGELAAAGLMIEPTGTGKLVGLCEANLRRALSSMEAPAGPELSEADLMLLDRREWKELGSLLLARQFRGPEFAAWGSLLERAVAEPGALRELAEQVALWERELKESPTFSMLGLDVDEYSGSALEPTAAGAGEGTSEAADSQEKRLAEARPQGRSAGESTGKSAGAASEATAQPSGQKSRRLSAYALIGALLVGTGLLGYSLARLIPNGNPPSATTKVAESSPRTERERAPAPKSKENPPGRKTSQRSEVLIKKEKGERLKEVPAGTERSPAAENNELFGRPADRAERESASSQPEANMPPLDQRVIGDRAGSAPAEKGTVPETAPNAPRQPNDPFQIPTKKQPAEEPAQNAGKPASPQSAANLPEPMKPQATPPVVALSEFPKAVDLGNPGDAASLIGPIPNLQPEQVSLQLEYDPETVARTRVVFEIQPQPERGSWVVISRKRAGDPESVNVGEFQLRDGELRFRWSEGIDSRSTSLALINCILKIEPTGGVAVSTALRQPILIEGFLLDDKTLRAEVKFELPAMPNQDNLHLLFGPFPKQGVWADALVLNENFEQRQPAVVVFRPLWNEQLLGLMVERRWRGQVELSAAWALQVPEMPGKPTTWMPLRQAMLKELIDDTAGAYTQAVAFADSATRAAEDAPTGSKTKMRDAATVAKNEMLVLKRRNELIGVHQEKLAGIRTGGIPIQLVYRTSERELLLAETPAAREAVSARSGGPQPAPPKDKGNAAKGMK